MDTLALVAVAYDRPESLRRLLGSLARVRVPPGREIPLVVSLDGDRDHVRAVAEAFEWPHGDYRIEGRRPHMGLRRHVLACGDLSETYGAVAVLEEDVIVSEDLVEYALAAIDAYGDEDRVAGLSLYNFRFNDHFNVAFHPLDSDHDTLFIQYPASSGQVWTRRQWSGFRRWYAGAEADGVTLAHGVPSTVASWPDSSWKRFFVRYLIETDKLFVFPRWALTTNGGDAGSNLRRRQPNFVSLMSRGRRSWTMAPLERGSLTYDAWLEPTVEALRARWGSTLPDGPLTVDFLGEKPPATSGLLLSSRPCKDPVATFPATLLPLPLNLGLPGHDDFFSLGPAEAFGPMTRARRRTLFELLNGQVPFFVALEVVLERLSARATRGRLDLRALLRDGWPGLWRK